MYRFQALMIVFSRDEGVFRRIQRSENTPRICHLRSLQEANVFLQIWPTSALVQLWSMKQPTGRQLAMDGLEAIHGSV